MQNRNRRLASLLAATLCYSLLLAACGTETTATDTPRTAPVTLVAPAPEPAVAATAFATRAPFVYPDPPVLGGIDGVSGELMSGGRIMVVGWAVDAAFGAPAARVEVVMNNKWTFSTKTGEPRPDVTKSLQRKDVNLSGWSAEIALGTLPAGSHTLGLIVFDVNGQPHALPLSFPIEIAASGAVSETVDAQLAKPQNAQNLTGAFEKVEGTARPGWVVIVTGWAADTKNKKPAAKIEFLIDGKKALEVKPTLERADVVEALKEDALLNSGFTGRVPLAEDLEEGAHTISAVAYDADGGTLELEKSFEITVLPKL